MKQFKKLFSAHFKTTFREKQVWFWSIFYPVMLLVVLLSIFGGFGGDSDADFNAKIALVAEGNNPIAAQIEQGLKQVDVLEWKKEEPVSREQAEHWLKDKDIDAVIVLPKPDEKQVGLLMNREQQNSATSQAMSSILSGILTQMNYSAAHITPEFSLVTDFISAGSDKIKYSDFLLTGLIALSICQAGLFGMVSMVEMRRNGLLKRLRLTPVNMGLFGLSNIMVRFILSAIQVVLLALIGLIFYGARFDINMIAFLLMFFIGTISFAANGFMIAALSKTMDSYFGIANLVSFIMMFLSGIFFDYSLLPSYIKPLADILPLTYFANGIRDGMVYGLSIMEPNFWLNIGVLTGWGLVTLLIGAKFYTWRAEVK